MNFLHILTYCCFIIISIISIESGIISDHHEDFHHPSYEYNYAIHDSTTGDVKDQFEHRHGDYVTGRYSLIEPDGYRRIVDYSSDPLIGFTAQVRREPASFH